MNALQSPNHNTNKTKRALKLQRPTKLSKRQRPVFSPITIPGTPEPTETQFSPTTAPENSDNHDDLKLYYQILQNYKPELGESNAESAARNSAFEEEYQRLKKKRVKNYETKDRKKNKHELSPFQPIALAVPFHTARPPSPIIEPIALNVQNLTYENHVANHVQHVTIDTDYSLYSNPDKPLVNEPINVIYDTGASISMLPLTSNSTWTNVRECLHTLAGCFQGQTESNLLIGEFHGVLTLDSGETVRVIIPECIQIPPGLSNTYLLADSAFLLAGHQYVSHLSKPKLKFEG